MNEELPNVPTCPVETMKDEKLVAAFGAVAAAQTEVSTYPKNTMTVRTPDGKVTVYRVYYGEPEKLTPIHEQQANQNSY